MIIMGFFSFILVLFRRNDGGRDDVVPVFLHSSLYKVLVSTGSFLFFKKEKSNACSQERRIMGRKREESIRRSVFVLQRDLKLSFPKQTNQKGKKKQKTGSEPRFVGSRWDKPPPPSIRAARRRRPRLGCMHTHTRTLFYAHQTTAPSKVKARRSALPPSGHAFPSALVGREKHVENSPSEETWKECVRCWLTPRLAIRFVIWRHFCFMAESKVASVPPEDWTWPRLPPQTVHPSRLLSAPSHVLLTSSLVCSATEPPPARQHSVRVEAPSAAEAGMRERPHFPTAQHRAGRPTPHEDGPDGTKKNKQKNERRERRLVQEEKDTREENLIPLWKVSSLSLLQFRKLFLCFTNCPPSTPAPGRARVGLPSPASKGCVLQRGLVEKKRNKKNPKQ